MRPLEIIVDSFAGGGGASTGIEMALGRSPDIAINHDPEAIAMHQANHPATRHYCENVWKVDPMEATGGKPVGLAWFSPDCTHFSKAKGGKPRSKKVRGLAWLVVHWAKTVRPRVIMLENVEEFADWGPLLDDGRPCPLRRGLTFRRWWRRLENLGYEMDARELRACDYGAPTSRKRLFIIARCDGQPICWPDATHGPGRLPYRVAADCIDWSRSCPSIFDRARPLADATLRRVAAGVMRYVVNAREPFIVPIDAGLVSPFITEYANASNQRNMKADEPLRTICAQVKGGHFALIAPSLVQIGYGERENQAPRALDLLKPLGTVVSSGKHALVSAFLAKHYTGVVGSDLRKPLGTITSVDHHSLVQAFLVAYYGNEKTGRSLREPLGTVVGHDRFGLVTVRGEKYCIADIGLRMLTPHELYKAQGFPESYIRHGSATSQVRMCGNSVSPPMAAALVRANLADSQTTRAAA